MPRIIIKNGIESEVNGLLEQKIIETVVDIARGSVIRIEESDDEKAEAKRRQAIALRKAKEEDLGVCPR